jgi:hypothetical protein
MNRGCGTCAFFDPSGKRSSGYHYYACRRYPPTVGENGSQWPKVSRVDFCGEYEPDESAAEVSPGSSGT